MVKIKAALPPTRIMKKKMAENIKNFCFIDPERSIFSFSLLSWYYFLV